MSKPVTIRVRDPQLWKDFQEFVLEKYGTKHTVLAVEFEKALYSHLSLNEWPGYEGITSPNQPEDSSNVHTHKKRFKPREERFLRSFYHTFKDYDKVHDKVLNDFIRAELMVKDWRTVRSWKEFLKSLGWINFIVRSEPAKWEVIILPGSFVEELGIKELES